MVQSIEDRVANLEARLAEGEKRWRAAEDQLEIIRLLSSYGPAVDSCSSQAAAELWTEDGAYDVGSLFRAEGRGAISALYEGEHHVGMTKQGSSHLTATPRITVNGDRAEAVAYSFVVLHGGGVEERFWIWRASVNHWSLERTAQGWKIVERLNRVLNGSEAAHDVMLRAVDQSD